MIGKTLKFLASPILLFGGSSKKPEEEKTSSPKKPSKSSGKKFIIFFRILFWTIVGLAVGIYILVATYEKVTTFLHGNDKEKTASFTTSGKGKATMAMPIRAYLDPLKTHTLIITKGNARYVLESDPNVFFIANEKPWKVTQHMKQWWAMPAGNYLVYPDGVDEILFSWY